MKVKFPCFDCRKEHKNGELIGEIDGRNDFVLCKCENGHSAKVFPQTPLYVYLLEHALDAYADEFCYESYVKRIFLFRKSVPYHCKGGPVGNKSKDRPFAC